ncbi:MAG: N-methylproline demethylase [Rhodospirillaceae bacterium]|nr:N-methylproline demethylase [Rhodospirillaceae bacterium]|tara:strand:+ start:832 stop:2883 length:2052 start_codon:yes stop_codon:yes gene_type:complete
MYDPATDPLLQPYQLKHLTLKNRIMSTAHEPGYTEDGLAGDRYIRYHAEKARGGIAMTMIAGSTVVARDSAQAFMNMQAWKDEVVPGLKRLTDACHEHGAAVMIQLTHLGRRTNWNKEDWLPVMAPSMVREPAHRAFPKEMEDWDIERVVKDYGTAAARMKEAGMDGIEFESYGHLMDQFWSPATNKRDDNYGGSLDNRLRFAMAVLDSVRENVGPDFIVGIRMSCDEAWQKGYGRDEGVEIARRFIATGKIDFLNVIKGHIDHDRALTDIIPVAGMRSSPHLDFAGEVKAETEIPIFHANKIADVATARHAIAEGKLDMVGMTRAHIADPHIVQKVSEGREEEIRPCVGATYCLESVYAGTGALCVHNASTGREATMPQLVAPGDGPTKKIVIVGAGPAGMEAARVAGERGHDVTLFEAADEPGGQVRLAARTPNRKDIIGIVEWRAARLEKLGVDLRFNTYAEADDVLAFDPDVVLVCTGGLPNKEIVDEGADLAVSSWDLLSGDVTPAEDVLVFDDNGHQPGMQAAYLAADAGASVEIISPERTFAPELGALTHAPHAEFFQKKGVTITINTRVSRIVRHGNKLRATLYSEFTESEVGERLVDQVVIEHATLPLDDLYFDLKPQSVNRGEVDYEALIAVQPQTLTTNPDGHFQLFRLGDAVESRNIHAAIYDALRLVRVM